MTKHRHLNLDLGLNKKQRQEVAQALCDYLNGKKLRGVPPVRLSKIVPRPRSIGGPAKRRGGNT